MVHELRVHIGAACRLQIVLFSNSIITTLSIFYIWATCESLCRRWDKKLADGQLACKTRTRSAEERA